MLAGAAFAAEHVGQAAGEPRRVVSIGTSITETVCALGAGARLVGVDSSSRDYIAEVATVPRVGAFRTISAEGIVSLKPNLVLATIDAGPPEAIIQLRQAGVAVEVLPRNYTLDEVKASVRQISRTLQLSARGEELVASIDRDMARVIAKRARIRWKPRVIFCGLGPNMPGGNISGTNTRIGEMIQLAGGVNAITGFEGFRPMTEEGVIAAAPDIIVITQRSFERAGGVDGILRLPGVALTPAGKNRRIVSVSDMYFQGFGPGIGKAALALLSKFFPDLH